MHIIFSPAEKRFPTNKHPAARGQCDCNCDCACASAYNPPVAKSLNSSLWHIADNIVKCELSTEYRVLFLPSNSNGVVLSLEADELLSTFSAPRPIYSLQSGLEVTNIERSLALLGLITPVESDCACISTQGEPNVCFPASSTLTGWFHLTDRCNLRCSYCYLPHLCEDMSPETGHAAIDALFRSAKANGFQQVKIKYSGGEPLLRVPFILDLHRYAESVGEKYGLGLEEVILSNGTLLTQQIAFTFASQNIHLMISMDGLGAYHDRHRHYAGGRGSFDNVLEGIEIALANGLVPNISITVSNCTAEGLPVMMAWILNHDLPFGLNFYRENEFSARHGDLRFDEQKMIDGMLSAFQVIENNLPRQSFLGGIVDRANLSFAHSHTCGVGQNYLVFNPYGQVAKCQMEIQNPVSDLDMADPLALIRTDKTGIQNISVDEKEGCKTCEWKYWCAGGCPLETHRATGRYDVKSPNCNIYKALFPEALRLEGLRLLKYQDDPEVVTKY